MGRRAAGLLGIGALVFALAACGGGGDGGDASAFCDSLEVLSEQVADGDLASDDGLEDAVETANDLLEAADGDQEDAVTEVGETLADADADEAEETAETIEDELGDFADDCDIEEFADAPETTTTTTEPEDEDEDETTTTEGDEDDEPAGELNQVGAPVDPTAAGVEAEFAATADLCFRGLMQACDDLFFGSDDGSVAAAPDGSVARTYGGQCGGRITEFVNDAVRCTENVFAAAPFDVADFSDPSFEDLADRCAGDQAAGVLGDMQACDDLFAETEVGSFEELYGDTCGGRIESDVAERAAACVEIFGATAEFG